MKIAVAGGTGMVGHHIVNLARERGHDVVVLSRSAGTDLLTGVGVADAMAGCEVVVDALGPTETSGQAAEHFFTTTSQHLQEAAEQVGARRIVVVSIVGIERASGFGYYRAKLQQEAAHRRGPVPATLLRSTQFFEFSGQIVAATRRGQLAFVPRMRTQPIAANAAARQILDAAEAPETPDMLEIGGPQEEYLPDMARRLASHFNSSVRVVAVPLPGAGGRAMRDGSLLPGPTATLAGPTFSDWLATLPTSRKAMRGHRGE